MIIHYPQAIPSGILNLGGCWDTLKYLNNDLQIKMELK